MRKIELTIRVLRELGYQAEIDEEERMIYFQSFGFDNFKESHQQVVREILGNSLIEFYYTGGNQQNIYYRLRKESKS